MLVQMMSGDLKGVGGVVVAAFLGGKEQLTGADVSGIRLNQRVVHYRLEFGRGRVSTGTAEGCAGCAAPFFCVQLSGVGSTRRKTISMRL